MQKISYKKPQYFQNKISISLYQLGRIPSFFFLTTITVYQWTFSPDHGIISFFVLGQCKFRPTCSEFTKQQIVELGALKGLKRGFEQIKQCH